MTDSQQYLYSALAQVAATLVGLTGVAYVFGVDRGKSNPEAAEHANNLTGSGGAMLMIVVLATSIALFSDGAQPAVWVSRAMLAVGFFPLAGALTYHMLWRSKHVEGSAEYERWSDIGTALTIGVGVAALLIFGAWIPLCLNRRGLGVEDLILMLLVITGGVVLVAFAFVHYTVGRPKRDAFG